MADKELSFSIRVDGISNEASEISKLEVELRNLRKEKEALMKVAQKEGVLTEDTKLKLAAYNKEIRENENRQRELKRNVEAADDSLTRMRTRLIELKKQYADGSAAIRQELAPQINKLTQDVSKAEQAIGVHSRGVGNYKNSIIDAAKELLGFGGIVALATTAVGKLKQAFSETEMGTKFFTRLNEAAKSFWQSIAGGDVQGAGIKALAAWKVAKDINESRIGDRKDLIEIARLENEIRMLQYKAADATLSEAEQLAALVKAQEKEDELIKYRIADKKEDLDITVKLLATRENDVELWDRYYQLQADIIQIEGERSIRLETRAAALRGKIMAASASLDMTQAQVMELMKYVAPEAEVDPYKEIENEKTIQEEKERIWQEGMKTAYEIYRQNKQQILNLQKEADLAEITMEETKQEAKLNIARDASAMLVNILGESKAVRYAELLSEKALAIAEVIINTQRANMAMTAWGAAMAIPTAGASIAFAQAMNIKNTVASGFSIAAIIAAAAKGLVEIRAQKESGGRITTGLYVNTGRKDDTLILANKTETVLTERQIAMLGGSSAMKKIGVPGYEQGGRIDFQAPYIAPVPPVYVSSNISLEKLFSELRNSIDARFDRVEVEVDLNKVRSGLAELEAINTHQPI